MIEKIGHIKNPLTIIAIFAGLAEVSGTAILPFISDINQSIFIWYLILFPSFLVIFFFITLNFNHKVLYAPSDYKDEENFLRLFKNTPPQDKVKRIKEEIKDSLEINDQFTLPETPKQSTGEHQVNAVTMDDHSRSLSATYFLAEELIIKKLSIEYGFNIKRDVTFAHDNGKYDFDGISADSNSFTVIEVKYMKTARSSELSINKALESVQHLFFTLTNDQKKSFRFILALGTDMPKEEHPSILNKVSEKIRGYLFDTEVKIYNIRDLEKEFELI
jgi:hypothetical protein